MLDHLNFFTFVATANNRRDLKVSLKHENMEESKMSNNSTLFSISSCSATLSLSTLESNKAVNECCMCKCIQTS